MSVNIIFKPDIPEEDMEKIVEMAENLTSIQKEMRTITTIDITEEEQK